MSTIDMRTESQQILERIDERFLAAVHALLKTYDVQEEPVVGYNTKGEGITVSQFIAEADEAVAAAKAGQGISVDELRKRSEGWLARSK